MQPLRMNFVYWCRNNIYLLKVIPRENTLKVCNQVRKATGVLYAHPNLFKKIHRR